ncbi:hypothetical protein [Microcoleus sp. CAWBG58]|uniref:hypothetical protein n=1 Tax=Microcoleus sp. CAWBG58 TaxID=2841651 RepID=UPI0025F56120|nr:hypothetical protein [Microcoleus sp. CAWBG58]
MTTGNPNHLDQKLQELKEIYKELEQAQIKKNNANTETEKFEAIKLHSYWLRQRNTKIEEIKTKIKEIENIDNETISSVLKEMEEYSNPKSFSMYR